MPTRSPSIPTPRTSRSCSAWRSAWTRSGITTDAARDLIPGRAIPAAPLRRTIPAARLRRAIPAGAGSAAGSAEALDDAAQERGLAGVLKVVADHADQPYAERHRRVP